MNERPDFIKLAKGSEVEFDKIHTKFCKCLIVQDSSNLSNDKIKAKDINSNKNVGANASQETEKLPNEQKDSSHSLPKSSKVSKQKVLINNPSKNLSSINDASKASTSAKIIGDKEDSIFDISISDNEAKDSEIKEKTNWKSKPVKSKTIKKVKIMKNIRVRVPKIKVFSNIKPDIKKPAPLKKKQRSKLDHPILRENFFHFNSKSYFNFQPWMKFQFKLTHDLFRKIEQASIQPKLQPSVPAQSKLFLKRNLKFTRSSKPSVQQFEKFVDDNRTMDFGIDVNLKDSNRTNFSFPEKKIRKKNALIFD